MDEEQDQISRAIAEIMASRPVFKVGDRVRIRLSGECRQEGDWLHGHDGCAGQVCMLFGETFGEKTSDAHEVFVTFEQDGDGRWVSSWFAPTELELVP